MTPTFCCLPCAGCADMGDLAAKAPRRVDGAQQADAARQSRQYFVAQFTKWYSVRV